MKKQVLFVQGGGAGTHDEWDKKLVDSLSQKLGSSYEVRYPRMPNEGDPSFAAWKVALAQEIADLEDGAIIVGHSIGGTILINAIAETPPNRKFDGIFLIAAPFVGAGGWPSEEIKSMTKLGARLPQNTPIHLYHDSEDDIAPFAHVNLYEKAIPGATVHRLQGRNHQLNDDLAEVTAGVRALYSSGTAQRGPVRRRQLSHS
jgi:predicted alpha/beta hydrolase family esterase